MIVNYYKSKQKELLSKFNRSASVSSHPGERGIARELFIKEYLREHLPKRFGLKSGHFYDNFGRVSNQLDIIYDAIETPTLFAEPNVLVLLVDSIAGVIQVKSTLDSDEFNSAIENLRSVKVLQHFKRDPLIAMGGGITNIGSATFPKPPLFSIIVAFRGKVNPETILQYYRKILYEYTSNTGEIDLTKLPLNGTYCLDRIGIFEQSVENNKIRLAWSNNNSANLSEMTLLALTMDLQRRLISTQPLKWDIKGFPFIKNFFSDSK